MDKGNSLYGKKLSNFFALLNSEDISKKWFDEYDKQHYSLENKLINLNKSIIKKINNGEWNKGYE